MNQLARGNPHWSVDRAAAGYLHIMEPPHRLASFSPSIFFFAGALAFIAGALLTLDGDRGAGLLNLVAGVVFVIAGLGVLRRRPLG
jgi:uncharacterized membrane protein HdeD (DUF308 family)